MSEQNTKLRNVGGLWRKKTKDQKTFFSGNIETENGKIYFNAFLNDYKSENVAQPDYRLYVSEPQGEAPVKPKTSAPKAAAVKTVVKKVVAKPAPVEEVEEETEVEEVLLD